MAPERIFMPEVLGRETELDALRRFLARIPEEPCALVLEGEPGIGKTTLWDAALAFAREHGLRVLWCRPAESEARLSYGALADLLADSVDEVLEELPGVQRKAIEVALLREATESPVDRRTVSAATQGVLRALSRISPVLLAVDDQQWIDSASAETLAFAIRRLTDEPVGFLAASRAHTGTVDPMGLVRAVPEDRLARVWVGPLELREIGELIRDRIGFVPSRAVLRRVHEVTGGNPFFALQLARALPAAGGRDEPSAALPVPEDLRDLLRARLANLPPATGETLLLASALSRPTVTLLEAAASDPEAVARDLRQSVTAGILDVSGDDVRFSHPLFAGAVYTEAPIARRREAHRRLAGIVTEPEERARHLALSSDQPEAAVADALEEAALHAVARGAPAAAAELCELAAVRTPARLEDDLRRRRLGAADAYLSSGDLRMAIGILETVLAGCPLGAARAEVLVELGRAHWEHDLAAAAGRFTEALGQPGIEPTVRVEAHLLLATCLADLGGLVEADSHVRAGADLAERLDHPGLIGWAMVESAGLGFYLGRGVERDGLLRAERRLNGADLPRHRAVDPDPNFELAVQLEVSDELDEARSRLHRTRAIASERGDEPWIAFCDAWLSDLEFRAGEWDLALRHAAASKLEASGIVYPGTPEHIIATHRGRAEAVRPAAKSALTAAERAGTLIDRLTALWTLATMEIVADDDPHADRFSGRAWELLRETGIGEPGLAQFVPDEAEVLIRLGRLAEAEELVGWLEERGRTLDRPRALATGARCRGLLLAAIGDAEEGLLSLERSVKEHERLPDPFERGRTLLALGTVRRHAKQKAAARQVLDEALAIFERLGATPWVQRVHAELAAIGGRPASSGQLTPTEERVARLAAAGRTNREIADPLFLSVRTVESHLSHAYAKLGVRSRTELALALDPRDDST